MAQDDAMGPRVLNWGCDGSDRSVPRAHHAGVGGITPGSMPPGSRDIDEEGALIPPRRVVRAVTIAVVAGNVETRGASWTHGTGPWACGPPRKAR
jgi:hypothetical protein